MVWPRVLARLFERRAWTADLSTWDAGDETAAGVRVTPDAAAGVPAVFACLAVLSQDVAKTPIKLRRRLNADTYADATDHALWEVLLTLPNPETTAYQFKRSMMMNLLKYERAYAQIVRIDGRITALWELDPLRMTISRDALRRKVYTYTPLGGSPQTWTFDASQPPILDLSHPSPMLQCRDLIGTALALQTYVGRFFANGGRPSGVLKLAGRMTDDQLGRLREQWKNVYTGVGNAHKVAILEGGLDFSALSMANDDAQLNQTLQGLRTEIAAVFRVPVWRVGDLSNANYSNLEAVERTYVSDALDPFFTCWEESIRRDLLTVRQYNQFSVTFDRGSLIRSDSATLAAALATGRQNGWYSPNDIRRKLGENPLPAGAGGDAYLINTALAAPEGEPDAHVA